MTKQIRLSENRRADLMARLQTLFDRTFDETLSDYRAEEIVAHMLTHLGPMIYNQAVQDVRLHLQTKLDDLDGEVYVDVVTADKRRSA